MGRTRPTLLSRAWMTIVAALVLSVAGFSVYKLHGLFGSTETEAAAEGASSEIVAFNPKQVTLEVYGPSGAIATVNYLDEKAQPQQAYRTELPWTYEITTTQPVVLAHVVAQGNSDSISCRITVNGEVKQERSVQQTSAYIYCLDRSA